MEGIHRINGTWSSQGNRPQYHGMMRLIDIQGQWTLLWSLYPDFCCYNHCRTHCRPWCPKNKRHAVKMQTFKCQWITLQSFWINSLWPSSDTIWRQGPWSPLVQLLDYCLTAPNHYLNQCWFIITSVLWHSHEINFTIGAHKVNLWCVFKDYTFEMTTSSSRG